MSVITNTAAVEHIGTMSEPLGSSTTTSPLHRPVWRAGLAAGAIAATANSAFAAVVHQFGASLEIAGEQIPILGFAQLTMVGAIVGTLLAAVLARRACAPRSRFVRVTVALVALSVVPDLVVDTDLATRFVLVLTHLIAAAIVVPAIARRLPR